MAANMAPGMNRSFLSESWKNLIPKKTWYDAMDEANDLVDLSVKTDIQGYDIGSVCCAHGKRECTACRC